MMPAKFDMSDYVPVNERIEEFVTAHPEGSLQSEIVELTVDRVTVKAYAYRTPDDPRPGIGHSSLEIPGSTPYTRGSEIENAETSAWGRAIAALGFEVKRGIASSEEIRNKQPGQGVGSSRRASANPVSAPAQYRRAELAALLAELHLGESVAGEYAKLYGVAPGTRASDEQMDQIIEAVRGHATGEELVIESAADVPAAVEPGAGGSPSPAPAPPKPSTPEYGALSAQEKAAARAYWAQHAEQEGLGLSA
jgi:hypothetical protein